MREIKFKFWKNNTKEMLSFQECLGYLLDPVNLLEGQYDNFKPLQFTGLIDKEGVEIYEGDIIRVNKLIFESSSPLPENLNVEYYGGMYQLYRGSEPLMGLHLNYIEDGEVIGNIYKNPELLNVKRA